MARRLVALLGALALLLAACGDDDGTTTATDDGAETTTDVDTDGTDGTDDEVSEDEQAAQAAVLTADDVPDDFAEMPIYDDDAEDPELLEELADCIGVDPEVFDRDYPSASSAFGSPTGDQVESEVTYTGSVDEAAEAMEVIRNEDTPDCLVQVFDDELQQMLAATEEAMEAAEGEELPPSFEVDDVRVDRRDVPDLGDEAEGLAVTVVISEAGQELSIHLDIILVRVDRVGVSMVFEATDDPFPADLADELTETVVDRVEV